MREEPVLLNVIKEITKLQTPYEKDPITDANYLCARSRSPGG